MKYLELRKRDRSAIGSIWLEANGCCFIRSGLVGPRTFITENELADLIERTAARMDLPLRKVAQSSRVLNSVAVEEATPCCATA